MSRSEEFKQNHKLLYHGTDEESAMGIDEKGLKANIYGVVYGSETFDRAAKRARERGEETGNAPRMVEFWAHKDNLSKPMSQRHDWSHTGNIPVRHIHSIYELNEDD